MGSNFKPTMDASQFIAEMHRVFQMFEGFAQGIENSRIASVKLDKHGQVLTQNIERQINKYQTLRVTIGQVKGGYKVLGSQISTNTRLMEKEAAAADELNRALSTRHSRNRIANQLNLPGLSAPVDATLDERARAQKSIADLRSFVRENEIGAKKIEDIWADLNRGVVRDYEGSMGQLQDKLLRVKQAHEAMGKAAQKENEEMLRALKEVRQERDRDLRRLEGFRTNIAGLAIDPKASEREIIAFERTRANLRNLMVEHNVGLQQVNKMWADVSAGRIGQYTGSLNQVEQAVISVNQAHKRLGTDAANELKKMTSASEGFLLSWRSIARIAAIQVLHQGVSRLSSAFREAVSNAIEFQRQLGEVQTLSQRAQLSTNQWATGLRRLSDSFGIPIIEQARGAYDALSDQIAEGTEVIGFMEAANRFALSTNSSLETSVQSLGSVINSFGLDARDAEKISAQLFKLIDLGRVTADELGASLGQVSVLTNQTGVSFEELSASLATLTINGFKFTEAMTQVRGVLTKFIKPTEAMKEFLRAEGFESGVEATSTMPLIDLLVTLRKHVGETGDEVEGLATAINRIRGQSFGLLVSEGAGYEQAKKALEEITNATLEYDKAVEIMMNNIGVRYEKAFNRFKNIIQEDFVQDMLTTFEPFVEYIDKELVSVFQVLANTLLLSVIPAVLTLIKAIRTLQFSSTAGFGVALGLGTVAGGALLTLAQQTSPQAKFRERRRILEIQQMEEQKLFETSLHNQVTALRKHIEEKEKEIREHTVEQRKEFFKQEDDAKATFKKIEKWNNIMTRNMESDINKLSNKVTNRYERMVNNIQQIAESLAETRFQGRNTIFDFILEDASPIERFRRLGAEIQHLRQQSIEAANAADLESFQTIRQRMQQLTGQQISEGRNLFGIKTPDGQTQFSGSQRLSIQQTMISMLEEEERLKLRIATISERQAAAEKQRVLQMQLLQEEFNAALFVFKDFKISDLETVQEPERLKKIGEEREVALKDLERIMQQFGMQLPQSFYQQHERFLDALKARQETVELNKLAEDHLEVEKGVREVFEDQAEALSVTNQQLQELKNTAHEIRGALLPGGILRESIPIQMGRFPSTTTALQAEVTRKRIRERESIMEEFFRQFEETGTVEQEIIDRAREIAKEGKDRILTDVSSEADQARVILDRFLELSNVTTEDLSKATELIENSSDVLVNALVTLGLTRDEAINMVHETMEAETRLIRNSTEAVVTFTAEFANLTSQLAAARRELALASPGSIPEPSEIVKRLRENREAEQGQKYGGVMSFAHGGLVPFGNDTVPAMLAPGEIVMNSRASRMNFNTLMKMNRGAISGSPVAENITAHNTFNINSTGNTAIDAKILANKFNREVRRGRIGRKVYGVL